MARQPKALAACQSAGRKPDAPPPFKVAKTLGHEVEIGISMSLSRKAANFKRPEEPEETYAARPPHDTPLVGPAASGSPEV